MKHCLLLIGIFIMTFSPLVVARIPPSGEEDPVIGRDIPLPESPSGGTIAVDSVSTKPIRPRTAVDYGMTGCWIPRDRETWNVGGEFRLFTVGKFMYANSIIFFHSKSAQWQKYVPSHKGWEASPGLGFGCGFKFPFGAKTKTFMGIGVNAYASATMEIKILHLFGEAGGVDKIQIPNPGGPDKFYYKDRKATGIPIPYPRVDQWHFSIAPAVTVCLFGSLAISADLGSLTHPPGKGITVALVNRVQLE